MAEGGVGVQAQRFRVLKGDAVFPRFRSVVGWWSRRVEALLQVCVSSSTLWTVMMGAWQRVRKQGKDGVILWASRTGTLVARNSAEVQPRRVDVNRLTTRFPSAFPKEKSPTARASLKAAARVE